MLRTDEKQVVKWTAEVQSNVKFIFTEYSATCRHTSVAEGMFVSC